MGPRGMETASHKNTRMNVSASFIPLQQKLEPTQRPPPQVVKQTVPLLAGTPMMETKPPVAGLDLKGIVLSGEANTKVTGCDVVHTTSSELRTAERTGPTEALGQSGFCTLAVTEPQIYMWEKTAPCPAVQTCTHTDRHTQTQNRHTDTNTWAHTNTEKQHRHTHRHTNTQAHKHRHRSCTQTHITQTPPVARPAAHRSTPSRSSSPGSRFACAVSATSCESIINSP